MARWIALIVASFLWLLAGAARADKAAATALFEEGRERMAAGDFAAACEKFAASHAEDASVGALLNLARCRERQGRVATAWAVYSEAAAFAARLGDGERARIARELASDLERNGLPTLTIRVTAPPGGLTISRNGEPVARGSWGSALPVDPGTYTLEATAPGHAPWSQRVSVGPSEQAVVDVPPLAPDAGKGHAGAGDAGGGGLSAQAIAGWTALGTGGASLIASAIFGGLTLKDKGDADAQCPDKACTSPEGIGLIDRAKTEALVSTVTLVVGAVLAAGGLTLVLTAPDGDSASAVTVTPRIGPLSGVSVAF